MMDLHLSLFKCTQTFGRSEDVIRGENLDQSHTLGWDKEILNLPRDQGYYPTKSWVHRFKSITGHMASFFT